MIYYCGSKQRNYEMEEDDAPFAIATLEYETDIVNLEKAKKHTVAAKANMQKTLKLLQQLEAKVKAAS